MLWKRKKGERRSEAKPMLVTRMAIWLNNQLIKWAAYLQQKTMQCSLKKLTVLAIVFCFASISFSTYIIISSLGETSPLFRVTPIQAMPLANKSLPPQVITEEEYLRFRRLKLSLDSLAKSSSGKVLYDSLLKERPHLLDTLKFLENIYFEQHKKYVYERTTNKSSAKTKGTFCAAVGGDSVSDYGVLGHGWWKGRE